MHHKAKSLCLCGALSMAIMFNAGLCSGEPNLVLRTGGTSLEVDSGSGVIQQIQDTSSGTTLAAHPGTAENFRLTLLKPDKSTITLFGKNQLCHPRGSMETR